MPLQVFTRAAEVKLVERLSSIEDAEGWRAIHFHLDELLEEYKSDYHIKIAINLISDLLKPYEGGAFVMSDRSIVVLANGLDKAVQNKLIFQLRYLYMDDLLAYREDGQENPEFSTAYDLARDWQDFMALASQRMALTVRKTAPTRQAKVVTVEDMPGERPRVADLSASRLVSIEHELRHADLSRVIRRQPVCAVMPGLPVRKVFDEIYIHIAHLRQALKAEVDFFSNKWLFKYLTQTLDKRMLAMIAESPDRYCAAPISLNLNAETLLSSEFSAFDSALSPSMKVSVVIEVPVVDVFSDIQGFMVARNEVNKLGYRLCLDGLNTRSFVQIDRDRLKLDLLKIQWNADAEGDLKTAENQALARAIEVCGARRIILCRCDSRQAVEYGQALGLSLFQGRYIDALLDPAVAIEN